MENDKIKNTALIPMLNNVSLNFLSLLELSENGQSYQAAYVIEDGKITNVLGAENYE